MKFSLQTLLLALTLTAVVGVVVHRALQEEPVPYRQYLNSIEGSDAWFRVGSYSVAQNSSTIEFDIYYFDSDRRPDGPQNSWTYPNSFGLFCVWQSPDGSWHHKELAGSSRTTFHKVVAEKTNEIELQLRSNFRMSLSNNDETDFENLTRIHDANKPYSCILMFENGNPVLKRMSENPHPDQQPKPPTAG